MTKPEMLDAARSELRDATQEVVTAHRLPQLDLRALIHHAPEGSELREVAGDHEAVPRAVLRRLDRAYTDLLAVAMMDDESEPF